MTIYPWPEAIALMTIFLMFFLELMTMRYGNIGGDHEHAGHAHGATPTTSAYIIETRCLHFTDSISTI